MSGRLAGKRAVVTAAGQGIGRETVMRFVAEGAHVIALDINGDTLAGLAAETACDALVVDVTDGAAISALVPRVGAVDIIASFAGYVASGSILECSDADWDRSFALNVTAMFQLIRALLPVMVAGGGGSVITMASVAGSIKGVPNRFAYGASKGAVIGMTKAIAADFVQQGIRANAICPGTVETPSLYERLSAGGNYDAARAAFIARQPMGRLGRAAEIADLAVYLASDESAFMSGQAIAIDGGWTI